MTAFIQNYAFLFNEDSQVFDRRCVIKEYVTQANPRVDFQLELKIQHR